MQVFAPLASRLGIWQIKWELEDLSFRFLMPEAYHAVAKMLDERRLERERSVERFRGELAELFERHGLVAEVQGRPKHLYSIWKKMQGKSLHIDRVFDLRAVRVLVREVSECYAALGRVHARYPAVEGEFDDYIARPKPNGYRSLHTVVLDDDGRAVEVQIRTLDMHAHAEHGVAAHWAYKEAGAKGYGGASSIARSDAELAEARKNVLRELLAWEQDLSAAAESGNSSGSGTDARAPGRRRPPHLRLHAAGGGHRSARWRHAARLRLRLAHHPRPSLPRRQGRRRDGAVEHLVAQRPDGGGDQCP